MGFFQKLDPNILRALQKQQQHSDELPIPRIMPPPKNAEGLPGGDIPFTPYKPAQSPPSFAGLAQFAPPQNELPIPPLPPPVEQRSRELPLPDLSRFSPQSPAVNVSLPTGQGFQAMSLERAAAPTGVNPDREGFFERSARLSPSPSFITPEDAELNFRRIGMKDFVRPTIDEGLRSEDGATRRVSRRDAGIPFEVQDLLKRSERPSLRDHSTDEPRGFWAKVKNVAEHTGKGFVHGVRRGGLGGGIVGAIAGGINPEFADKLEYQDSIIPQWEHDQAVEEKLNDEVMNRGIRYGQMSGVDPFSGQPTAIEGNRDRNYELANNRFLEQQDKNDAALAATQKRLNQTDRRMNQQAIQFASREKQNRINTLLNAAKIPGRQFDEATRAELENEGITLPADFNPQTHTIKVADDGSYQVVSLDKGTGKATTAPVMGANGQPMKAPERQGSKPAFYYKGKAQQELMAERGITDPSALVDNPAFADAVRRETELDQQNASARGLPPSTRAQIERRVSRKTPQKIRAGSLITPAEIQQRQSQIYERENKTAPKGKAAPAPQKQQQMDADEQEFQKIYPRLNDQQRQQLEDAYRKEHGRPPRRPQGAANALPGRDAQGRKWATGSGEGLNPFPVSMQSGGEIRPIPPAAPLDTDELINEFERFGDRRREQLAQGKRAPIDKFQMDSRGEERGGSYETRLFVPKKIRKDLEKWKPNVIKRDFLVTHAGWTPRTFRKWQKLHGSEDSPLPDFSIGSGKADAKGVVTLRVSAEVLKRMRAFGSKYTNKKFDPSAPVA